METFTRGLAGYQDLQELNTAILDERILEIRVSVKYTEDGVKKQKIQILYQSTCCVDDPANDESIRKDRL